MSQFSNDATPDSPAAGNVTMDTPPPVPQDPGGTFLGHPTGLFVLFFAEMWERFSYYGMRALLVLYMVDPKHFGYTDKVASETYGAYTGLVYATPLIGGLLADRLMGYRRAIFLGGLLMAIGHLVMTVPNLYGLYLGMAFLVAGNGLFKPNISTLVGKLYPQGDPRKDGGFTIFYMGINVGAFLAGLICGGVGEKYGWHYGFGLATIGMLLGLFVFTYWGYVLGDTGLPPDRKLLHKPTSLGLSPLHIVYVCVLVFVPIAAFLVWSVRGAQYLVPAVGGAFLIYIIYEMIECTREERGRMVVAIVLIFFSITFWACFEQAGSSMNLFTQSHVDRHIGGWEVPTTWFQSVNPMFIFILAVPFSLLWSSLGKKNCDPSPAVKFGLGIIIMALGFVAMVFAAKEASGDGKLAWMGWVIIAYLLHTTGELCLSPVGLSTMTKYSPARLAGMMMGLWFMSNAAALVIAGIIAGMTGEGGGYEQVYLTIVYFAGGAGIVLLILSPFLKRLTYGAK